MPACLMGSGVGKSGSPAVKSSTGLPALASALAFAAKARVGEPSMYLRRSASTACEGNVIPASYGSRAFAALQIILWVSWRPPRSAAAPAAAQEEAPSEPWALAAVLALQGLPAGSRAVG